MGFGVISGRPEVEEVEDVGVRRPLVALLVDSVETLGSEACGCQMQRSASFPGKIAPFWGNP